MDRLHHLITSVMHIHIAMPSKTHIEHILQKYCWSWHIGIGSVSRLVCDVVVLYITTDYWLNSDAPKAAICHAGTAQALHLTTPTSQSHH